MCSGRQSRPHLFHVVRKVCTKSGHVSTIPPVVKNNSHHGISTIKSDYPMFFAVTFMGENLGHKAGHKDWRRIFDESASHVCRQPCYSTSLPVDWHRFCANSVAVVSRAWRGGSTDTASANGAISGRLRGGPTTVRLGRM